MKYFLILYHIFVALVIIGFIVQNRRIDQLEENVKIQRVEINSLVKNKAWVKK